MTRAYSEAELLPVAQELLAFCKNRVIRLDGEMGTGKTTLIKALCLTLGVEETISSPTFSLVNHYRSATNSIYHFDFYRIEHPNEVADIGIEEYFESGAYCFLEWADKIKPHLPLAYDHFVIELLPNTQRRISKIESREH